MNMLLQPVFDAIPEVKQCLGPYKQTDAKQKKTKYASLMMFNLLFILLYAILILYSLYYIIMAFIHGFYVLFGLCVTLPMIGVFILLRRKVYPRFKQEYVKGHDLDL